MQATDTDLDGLLERSPAPVPARTLITDPDGLFPRHYNRNSFMFPHSIGAADGFTVEGVAALASRLPQTDEYVYWSNGPIDVTARWEDGRAEKHSLQDTIRNIASNNSIVILKHTEQDPVLGPILRQFLAEVVERSGQQMRDDVVVGEALVLIASPNRITSYHIDAEANYLVQLVGDKTLNVFDPSDRSLVTHEELERFHDGDYNGAVYKPERQSDAQTYDLRAGHGVHIPTGAPHWVQNGNNVSIALSINYELNSIDRVSRIYRFNNRIRRYGAAPTAPGVSAWRDKLKLAAASRLLRVPNETGTAATWTP
ncbi:hypothetical protein [Lichenicoccus roseus]|uniref:JmjC domain-containing protein n=1 Tax=Lichenicoccus roseus TaxID=2683649 RepID=A0A5R9J1X2_9PROT|nr:hypothetical protein [Lichenicoccus roseus]TLU70853.1 hypothetical protein FE263_19910 [Lichenicoccus roseus]